MPIPHRKKVKEELVSLLAQHGPLKTKHVYSFLADQWALSNDERSMKRSGGALYQNEIRWARQELVAEGYIAKPAIAGRAIWKLAAEVLSPELGELELDPTKEYFEGALKKVQVNAYERSKEGRSACLNYHGYKCTVCDFDFETFYGLIGKNRIHVHHLIELSAIAQKYKLDPINDMVPICANCHLMAHQRRPSYSIAELKNFISERAQGNSSTSSGLSEQ